jgi:alpha-1,3-rhamnosyl/mannosyltransferase
LANIQRRVLVDLLSYTGSKGGTDVYIRNLYENINKLSHNFEFIGFASKDAKILDMSWFPGPIVYSRLGGNNKVAWALGEIYSLARFSKKIKPEIIHCPANFGPLKSKFKVVLTLHDALYWSKPHLAPNKVLLYGVRFMQRFTTRFAASIITDSRSSLEDIEMHLGIPSSKIRPIYLGANSKAKIMSPVNKNNLYFLAGGNRFRHKNWENLLKAWSLIELAIRPNLIVTGGGAKDPLVKLVEKFSLGNNVKLLQWVSESELENLYLNAEAVIIPSLHEGFSLPVLQAMSAKKPLILSKIPVHLELAEEIAHFFDPNSPNSIADTVLQFKNDKVVLEEKIMLGFKKAKHFSWEKCASETLHVFGEV